MINQESEFTVEEIEQRAKENSEMYFTPTECSLHATCFGCPGFDNNTGKCNFEFPEESYYW